MEKKRGERIEGGEDADQDVSFPSLLPFLHLSSLTSLLPICPYCCPHISIPVSPLATSHSTPSLLRHPDFTAIWRKPFITGPCIMFPKYEFLIRAMLHHEPGSRFLSRWREAA
ncbi:unnamed protein product [Pleuronectes platessa]|uniref:Uncharacterized protein n=1 Tax=Pleuronectes platessa TaxID=8262 RepID=A0A9N7U2S1_PLEPL|nr:unnamed protein product [Pleuronectes platessa]